MNSLRQVLLFQLEPDRIVLCVSEVCKPFRQTHHKKDRGVDAHRDAGIALFNFDEGRSTDRGALGNDGALQQLLTPRAPNP